MRNEGSNPKVLFWKKIKDNMAKIGRSRAATHIIILMIQPGSRSNTNLVLSAYTVLPTVFFFLKDMEEGLKDEITLLNNTSVRKEGAKIISWIKLMTGSHSARCHWHLRFWSVRLGSCSVISAQLGVPLRYEYLFISRNYSVATSKMLIGKSLHRHTITPTPACHDRQRLSQAEK